MYSCYPEGILGEEDDEYNSDMEDPTNKETGGSTVKDPSDQENKADEKAKSGATGVDSSGGTGDDSSGGTGDANVKPGSKGDEEAKSVDDSSGGKGDKTAEIKEDETETLLTQRREDLIEETQRYLVKDGVSKIVDLVDTSIELQTLKLTGKAKSSTPDKTFISRAEYDSLSEAINKCPTNAALDNKLSEEYVSKKALEDKQLLSKDDLAGATSSYLTQDKLTEQMQLYLPKDTFKLHQANFDRNLNANFATTLQLGDSMTELKSMILGVKDPKQNSVEDLIANEVRKQLPIALAYSRRSKESTDDAAVQHQGPDIGTNTTEMEGMEGVSNEMHAMIAETVAEALPKTKLQALAKDNIANAVRQHVEKTKIEALYREEVAAVVKANEEDLTEKIFEATVNGVKKTIGTEIENAAMADVAGRMQKESIDFNAIAKDVCQTAILTEERKQMMDEIVIKTIKETVAATFDDKRKEEGLKTEMKMLMEKPATMAALEGATKTAVSEALGRDGILVQSIVNQLVANTDFMDALSSKVAAVHLRNLEIESDIEGTSNEAPSTTSKTKKSGKSTKKRKHQATEENQDTPDKRPTRKAAGQRN